MGTNYYLRPPGACQRQCSGWLHLGKQSAGWQFLFHGYRATDLEHTQLTVKAITSLQQFRMATLEGVIYDERGDAVSRELLLEHIDAHRHDQAAKTPDIEISADGHPFYYGDFS